jgi:hypothetical protein
MIGQQLDAASAQAITLDDRRHFLMMPLSERRRRLAELADRAMAEYEKPSDQEKDQRSEWQGGDIIEY